MLHKDVHLEGNKVANSVEHQTKTRLKGGVLVLRIYTDMKYIPTGYSVVLYNDSYFDSCTKEKRLTFRNESLGAIKIIDKADLVDARNGTILTPFGLTDLNHLSTGCKTLVNILETSANESLIFSLNECGANVLSAIVGLLNNSPEEFKVYLTIGTEFIKLKDCLFYLNDGTELLDVFKIREVLR